MPVLMMPMTRETDPMKKSTCVILSLILICAAFSGCDTFRPENIENQDSVKTGFLHETPQIYYLADEDEFRLMPTVTLFENGNARLSQPWISSIGLFGMGSYEINGDELTVSYGESEYQNAMGAVFTVSDDGDTLTLESATIGFTEPGSVYKYRSDADYIKSYKKVDGKKLTLDRLRKLANSGQPLVYSPIVFSDFDGYACVENGSDYRRFDIDGEYTLAVWLNASNGGTHCVIERNSSGDSFYLSRRGTQGDNFDEFLGSDISASTSSTSNGK